MKGSILAEMKAAPNAGEITWLVCNKTLAVVGAKRNVLLRLQAKLVFETLGKHISSILFDRIGSFVEIEGYPLLLKQHRNLSSKNHIFTYIHYQNGFFAAVSIFQRIYFPYQTAFAYFQYE